MGQTCCRPVVAHANLADLGATQELLARLFPPGIVLSILPYLFWPPVSAEMAVECVLAGHPGAATHLPAALQLPMLSTKWCANPDVTLQLRRAVVEWLMRGSDFLGLDHQWCVLHRAVLLLDCCMQRKAFPRNKLQLLAVAVLLLACKYEGYIEVTRHSVADITNGACTAAEISTMEWQAFQLLDFQVGPATTWEWSHELAHRRKRALTPEECYRLDASLLQNGAESRMTVAQQVIRCKTHTQTHAILHARYPDVKLTRVVV